LSASMREALNDHLISSEVLLGSAVVGAAQDVKDCPLVDGVDCSPGDAADTYEISAAGTVEDCDGDGQRRADISYAPGGMDCNDRDPAVRPGATDDCADAIDQDCNPSTCPLNDAIAPVFTAIGPASGSAVGCHSAIEVTVEDEGNVASVSLLAPDLVSGGNDTLVATQVGDTDVWRFGAFNELALSTTNGLLTGTRALTLQAFDQAGNRVRRDVQYDFRLMAPNVPSLTPATVGRQTEPFVMTVEATGAASVGVWAAARGRNSLYTVSEAILVGEASGVSGAFTVDPAQFADGQWLLFPRIEDAVGNRLTPSAQAIPVANAGDGTLEMTSDFVCVGAAPQLPVRVLSVGGGGFDRLAWGGLLATALAAAAAEDETLALVSIVGIGVDAEGRIDLSDATSFSNRWVFGFREPGTTRTFSASWLTPALNPGNNPLIDPAGSGVVADIPIADPDRLPDSTALMASYAANSRCRVLSGRASDVVVYTIVDGAPQVTVSNEDGDAWLVNIEPDGSIREVFDCP
ncbi:MAG: putative metal-binding motif-containing protein, partial [Myxococcota bacterium]